MEIPLQQVGACGLAAAAAAAASATAAAFAAVLTTANVAASGGCVPSVLLVHLLLLVVVVPLLLHLGDCNMSDCSEEALETLMSSVDIGGSSEGGIGTFPKSSERLGYGLRAFEFRVWSCV